VKWGVSSASFPFKTCGGRRLPHSAEKPRRDGVALLAELSRQFLPLTVFNLNYAQNERSARWFRAADGVRD